MPARTDLEHKSTAPKHVGCYIVTVSDTRTEETDTGGRLAVDIRGTAEPAQLVSLPFYHRPG